MNARIVAALIVLAATAASAASATTLTGSTNTDGALTTYTYSLASTESGDYITSVHVYAQLAVGLIQGYTGPANWSFDAFMDPEVGADIYWYADDYDLHGIPNGGHATFILTVPSWTTTNNSYVIPGCFGNWGYETLSWPGAVLVSLPSVPVPEGAPEPACLVALATGCAALAGLRRARR
jgi:hypothetical protein